MKNTLSLILVIIAVLVSGYQATPGQFTIKIPKIKAEKPKTEQPKTDVSDRAANAASTSGESTKSGGKLEYMYRPSPNGVPQFMRDTIEIKAKTENRYWKVPNQDNYSSWLPQVSFDVFFDNSVRMRYTAEWSNPDGSPWFSEPLDFGTQSAERSVRVSSSYSAELFATKAAVATGTYGLKVVNTKNNEVVFQGKFKVNKIATSPGDARQKNRNLFYVDNDWLLNIGYVGFDSGGHTSWDYNPKPNVYLWFKGNLSDKDFESRLFFNDQEIASSDGGGVINTDQERGEECYINPELCKFKLWVFNWKNFVVENEDTARAHEKNLMFTRDKPGEYTVKIFHRGTQVRETKFNIDSKGWIARNAFSDQMFLTYYKVAVPVKVMGTLEKWSSATAKTDAFYGNPLTGFQVQ